MKQSIALAFAAALIFCTPGANAAEIDVECGVRNAPEGFGDVLLQDLLEEEEQQEGELTAIDEALIALVTSCMGSDEWTEEETENFVIYSMGRIASTSARAALVGAGVRMDVIDPKLEISWRSPPKMPDDWDPVLEREIELELKPAEKSAIGLETAAIYLGFYVAMYDEGARALAALSK